jgi:hypothetical protein
VISVESRGTYHDTPLSNQNARIAWWRHIYDLVFTCGLSACGLVCGERGPGATTVVSTVAGGGVGTFVDGSDFNGPICLTLDASSNIFVSNLYENKIRKVTPTGGAHASIELVCLSRVESKVSNNHSSVIRCSCFKM